MTKPKMTYEEALEIISKVPDNMIIDNTLRDRRLPADWKPDPRFYRFGEDDIEKVTTSTAEHKVRMALMGEVAEVLFGPI